VYRRADGSWSRDLQVAEVVGDEPSAKAHAAAALAKEQRNITDPYVIEVFSQDGKIDPLSARERIRATGPTVHTRRISGLDR